MARFVHCAETRDELTCCVNPAIKCFLPKTRIFIQEKGRKRNTLYLFKLSSDSLMNYGLHYFRICLPFLQLERLSVMLPKSINNLFKPYLSKGTRVECRSKSQVSDLCFKKIQRSKMDGEGKGIKKAQLLICNVILGIFLK